MNRLFHRLIWFEGLNQAFHSQGDRIRELFRDAKETVSVIAPYVKVDALKSLLDVIPPGIHVRCVTRWRPHEVAAGVSDPEIFELLELRGNCDLLLVDNLHAKLYVADNNCLAGSSNVTQAGLGASHGSNIEILISTSIDDLGVAKTLQDISRVAHPATKMLAKATRSLAQHLPTSPDVDKLDQIWFPKSRFPDVAFEYYAGRYGNFLRVAQRLVLQDLVEANVPLGLSEDAFKDAIRERLALIPLAELVLNSAQDVTLTRADASMHLESFCDDEFSPDDLWNSFVAWMTYFFPDSLVSQPVAEVALRRARLLS